ncbi:hypothetical protein [Paraburkholderia sp. UCT2]|uniref:hypothetical protein n=1 Tax=Paraburkholderia sp. UCT2 TaxID=2615208 RepID=UPI0016558105|nr:hypothetical protein [Paraburkholderia sp. UCT2]MBC8726841.1 hypothetical protein [Paraburkholderia sp. UCT2]
MFVSFRRKAVDVLIHALANMFARCADTREPSRADFTDTRHRGEMNYRDRFNRLTRMEARRITREAPSRLAARRFF